MFTDPITEHLKVIGDLSNKESDDRIRAVTREMLKCIARGNKILVCGNGGSAADAQHFAGEMVGRFQRDRRGYHAEALTTDTSILTAVGNDYAFEDIFARQVEAKGAIGDILIAISTSGESANIIRAVEAAERKGMLMIGLSGAKEIPGVDYSIVVPSTSTPRVQEAHILILHMLADLVEREAG